MHSCFDTRSLHTRRRCLEQPLRFIATTRVAVFVHSAKTGGATASAFLENCSGVFVAYAAHTLTAAQVIATGRAAILTLRDPAQRAVSNTQWAGGLGKEGRTSSSTRYWDMADIPAIAQSARSQLFLPLFRQLGNVSHEDASRSVIFLCSESLDDG